MKFKRLAMTGLILSIALSATSVVAAEMIPSSTILTFDSHSLVKQDGTYWIWGNDTQSVPTQLQGLTDVRASFDDQLIMKEDGTVWHWTRDSARSMDVELGQIEGLRHLVDYHSIVYADSSVASDADGAVFRIPKVERQPDFSQLTAISGLYDIIGISSYTENGENRWLFLRFDGTVWKDMYGSESVEQIQSLDHVVQIDKNMAVKEDGTVWTLPTEFESGKLTSPITATQMEGLANIRMLRSTYYSNVAIDKESRLYFWGATITGWSDGTMHPVHPDPILITSIGDVKDAFVVERSLVVLTNDGKVYEASIERENMPSDPEFKLLASDISQIKGDDHRHLIMQKTNGSLYGWGVNKDAQLGYGDYLFFHHTPVPVQKPISVEFNGEAVALSNGVITRNNQAFVPIRSVFEKMGAKVKWDGASQTVTISRSPTAELPTPIELKYEIIYKTGSANTNEEFVVPENTPFGINGVSYVPLRSISEALGAKVNWVQKDDKISIVMK